MKKEELFDIIGEVDEQKVAAAGMAMNAQKKSRPSWLKWGVMAACLCIVVVGVITPQLQQNPGGAAVQPGGTPSTEVQLGNNTEITQPADMTLLVVNEVENMMTADMDVKLSLYNELSASEQETLLNGFEAAVGLSYGEFTAKIPDTLVSESFYTVNVPADASRAEYIPHDYVLEYQAENDGAIRIAICSTEVPLRDWLIECDNPKLSEINGVSVVVYGYQDTFIAEFSYKGISYEIETTYITLEELEDLLVGITDESKNQNPSEVEDQPADGNGIYHENPTGNLPPAMENIFCGSYTDSKGQFVVVLIEDTPQNRSTVCKELGIKEERVTFQMGTYTLQYLTELQSKISEAMVQKELPFVVASSVNEISNRITINVTTDDETLLKKVLSLDTIGGAIEIQVSEGELKEEIAVLE